RPLVATSGIGGGHGLSLDQARRDVAYCELERLALRSTSNETDRLVLPEEIVMHPTPPSRTWFITGASRGLGHALAVAALDRGDRVVAAARTATTEMFEAQHLDRVLALSVDVTDKSAVDAAVAD